MHHCQKDGGGVEPINNWSKPQHSSQLCIGDLQIPHTHLVNFSLFVSRRRILQVGSFCRGYYSGGICFIVIGLNAMSPCYVSIVMTHTNWQLIRCMWFDLEDKIVLCPQKLSCTVELMNDDTKPAHNCVQARRLLGSLVSEWRMCLNFGETRDCAFLYNTYSKYILCTVLGSVSQEEGATYHRPGDKCVGGSKTCKHNILWVFTMSFFENI
jgi:hypothetical protein